MDKKGIKRKERLLISNTMRTSGTDGDFFVQFPVIDNVVSIEWASITASSLSTGSLICIEGFDTSKISNGIAFWRTANPQYSIQRRMFEWEFYPSDCIPRKLNTLHIRILGASGSVDAAPGNIFIEVDVFCLD